ncbi:hypothetical protein H180DRAFT_00315 [Streptomyces sp. WMMB 322]|nr:hypothetical protein H180DRAFT_00315 [Streptomyces sp. WMMB 322]
MPKVLRTLIICSLLMAGAVSPAVAAGTSPSDVTSAQSVHINDNRDEHTP